MTDLLPPNARAGDRALSVAVARAADVPVTFPMLWDPASCPMSLLPWLAWGLSVDVWDADWSEATKRRMVAEAIERQRRKGSVAAVQEILDAFDVGLTLHEWFDPDVQGQPFTFEVRLPIEGGETVTAVFIEKVLDQVARVKPARAWFTVAQTLSTTSALGLIAFGRPAIARRLDAAEAAPIDWSGCLLTENGEPLFTEDDLRLEEDL